MVEPTLEQFSDDAAPESASEELEEDYPAPQPTYSPMGDEVTDDPAAAQLWTRAQRALSWLMGCTHGPTSVPSQPQLTGPAQLQVTGSSEALPAAFAGPSGLLQRLTVARPAKLTMLLGSIGGGQSAGLLQSWGQAAETDLAQQEPLMMQKDGVIRPQKLANLLQSLSSAQAAARMLPAEAAVTVQPQVLMFQMPGFEQPQSFAAILQQLPWVSFGQQLRGEPSALPLTELLVSEEAEVMAPTARAAIPGQNGATVVLTNAQPFGQNMMQQASRHLTRLHAHHLADSVGVVCAAHRCILSHVKQSLHDVGILWEPLSAMLTFRFRLLRLKTNNWPRQALWPATFPAQRLLVRQALSWHKSSASRLSRRWTRLSRQCSSSEGEVRPF